MNEKTAFKTKDGYMNDWLCPLNCPMLLPLSWEWWLN